MCSCLHSSHVTPCTAGSSHFIACRQDLGLGGAIQGKHVGAASAPSSSDAFGAIAVTCTGSTSQQWDAVNPTTGRVVGASTGAPPFDVNVHLRQRSTGRLLEVPTCARAPLPAGLGPEVGVTDNVSTASGKCDGANVLWQFHKNGTITTAVDGSCLQTRESRSVVQTFACERQGMVRCVLLSFICLGL
jgi:hypothetical protein